LQTISPFEPRTNSRVFGGVKEHRRGGEGILNQQVEDEAPFGPSSSTSHTVFVAHQPNRTPSRYRPPTPPISQVASSSIMVPSDIPQGSVSFVVTPRKTSDGISIDIKTLK
jgi:hypothetical protein